MRGDLTWTCHVCGDERPDALISVYSETTTTDSGIEMRQNIRYCNDRPACREGAPSKILRDLGNPSHKEER